MQEVIYKQKDGVVLNIKDNELPRTFNGYKITKYYNKASAIFEYSEGKQIGEIGFRPTKTPVIFYVKYSSYNEERYNNGHVSVIFYTNQNGIQGEYRRYDTNGTLSDVRFYKDNINITENYKSFLNYTGKDHDFVTYKYTEEEMFNTYMMYGNEFKFYNEYKMDRSHFREVVKFCLE